MIFELIENNFVAVATTLFLILFILTNNNFERRTNLLFLAAAFCVLMLIVTEAWEAHLAVGTVFTPLRTVLSAIGYTLRPMVAYCLVLMVKHYTRPWLLLLSAPVMFNAVVAFSSLFCGVSFGYTPENEFVRGPLGVTPFVVAGFYVVVLLTLTLRSCRNGSFVEAMIVSAIVLLAFCSTVMESLFDLRFIQNPSIAVSITFYYLFLHSNQSNRDPLTGALTRRRFYLDADKNTASLSAVISLDLNDLKSLNDQYGHVAGDQALMTVSQVILNHTGTHALLYRTGGDEFMILCHRLNEEKVQSMIAHIRGELAQTDYRCAIGYALCSHPKDFDAVCQQADHMMYENKRQMKHQPPTGD